MSIILAGFLDTRDLDDVERIGASPAAGGRVLPRNSISHTKPVCHCKWTYWFDFIIATFLVVALILYELDVFPQYLGGFYCDDPAISHKFNGDTVSISMLLLSCALLPFFMILIIELILYNPEKISYKNTRCKSALKNVFVWYGEYLLAFIFNLVLMDVMKYVVGETRPHFLDTCSPDAAVNCTPGEYISEYKCTNTEISPYYVRDSNKSFPSGHTSLSIYFAIFLFCYLQARAGSLRPRLISHCLQLLVSSFALVSSLTRITDHRHHWWDVLGGFGLGVVLAYYSVAVLCKNFQCDNPQLSRSVTSNGDSEHLDNHNSVRRLISTYNHKQDDLDSDSPTGT